MKLSSFLKAASALVPAISMFLSISLPSSASSVIVTKSLEGDFVISGLSPYGLYSVEYYGKPKVKRVVANSCGVVSLRHSSSFPIYQYSAFRKEGTNYYMSSLPVGAAPKCTDGVLAEVPIASAFQDSSSNVYFSGLVPHSKQEITFHEVPTTRRVKANACGVLSVKKDPGYPIGSSVNVREYSTAGAGSSVAGFIPSSSGLVPGDAPVCHRGKLYLPENWTGTTNYAAS